MEQPRQTGKSLVVFGYAGWMWGFGANSATMVNMHFNKEFAMKNKNEYILRPLNNLPKFMRFHSISKVQTKDGIVYKDGKEYGESQSAMMMNEALGNNMRTITPGLTDTKAMQAGRSLTAQGIFIDEWNFIVKIEKVLTSIVYAFGTAAAQAQKRKDKYCLNYLSTPGDLNTSHGEYCYDFIFNKTAEFSPKLFDLTTPELREYLRRNAKVEFFRIISKYQELGLDKEWLNKQIARNGVSKGFRTDVLVEWARDFKDSLFTEGEIARLHRKLKSKYVEEYIFEKYYKITYFPQDKGDSFENMIRRTRAM
ncbi:MAG: hypothetical protein ACRC6R_03920, partial [Bacteroidales bacterium]